MLWAACLYEGSIVSGVVRCDGFFLPGRWLAVVDWGSSLSAAKAVFLHGAMAGIVSSRMLGFAAAIDAVSVFFLKLVSYRYHILATSQTRCYYALAKITKGVA